MLQSDETLARNIQQGHTEDLTSLVERYHGPLLGYLYRLTYGDGPLAEDLVQEAFFRALRQIDQYRYPQRFKPWLYAIATNLARDHYKRLSTRQTRVMTDAMYEYPDSNPGRSPEAVALVQDEVAQVKSVLTALPDHQREVVLLRYIEEMSLAEISETLSVPVGTVKSRLSLGLKRMRMLLAEEETDA